MPNIKIIIFSILTTISACTFSQVNPYSNPTLTSQKLLNGIDKNKIDEFCSNAEMHGTQALIGCRKYEWEKIDFQLDAIYTKQLKQKKNTQLINSQKKWKLHRNKECNDVYFSLHGDDTANGGGTEVPLEYMDCMIDSAKSRIQNISTPKK